MEGRRFGFGIAAGLVLGLAIITASGGLSALQPASFSPSLVTNRGAGEATQTVTNTQTMISTATTVVSSTYPIAGVPTYSTSGNKSSSSATTTATTQSTPSPAFVADLNSLLSSVSGGTPSDASRVASIAHQPLSTDLVVLIPLLLAFLLGAALYLSSNRKNQQPDAE